MNTRSPNRSMSYRSPNRHVNASYRSPNRNYNSSYRSPSRNYNRNYDYGSAALPFVLGATTGALLGNNYSNNYPYERVVYVDRPVYQYPSYPYY